MSIQFTRKNKIYILISALLILLLSIYFIYNFKNKSSTTVHSSIFANVNPAYADTTLKYMSLEEKIGQLIIADFGKVNNTKNDSLTALLYQIMPAGIIYDTDSLSRFINYQNIIQKYSKINLFTFLNKDSTVFKYKDLKGFPDFKIFSYFKNDTVRYNYLNSLSEFAKTMNLSSVNSLNKNRFKGIKSSLYRKIIFDFIQSANEHKLLSIAHSKLFIENDSVSKKETNTLINNGLTGIYFGKEITPYEFKKRMADVEFDGLIFKQVNTETIFSDSIAKFINSGVTDIITDEPEKMKLTLLKLAEDELISEETIDEIVRKILLAKTLTGIHNNRRILPKNVSENYNSTKTQIAIRSVYKNSINLIKNTGNVLSFKNLRNAKFSLLILGKTDLPDFYKTFYSYYPCKKTFYKTDESNFLKRLKSYKKQFNQIVVFNDTKVDRAVIKAIIENNKAQSLSIINFGKPDNLNFLDTFSVVIQTFNSSKSEQIYAADALFGGINLTENYLCKAKKYDLCDSTAKINKVRVSKCLPEEVGLNSSVLNRIDSVVKDGIYRGAFPGCQVVVFKNGCNVYDKAFGYHTYAKRQRVRKTDLYDLASVTKIAATTTAAMKLYSQGRLRLNDKLGRFFRDTKIDYLNIKPDTVIHVDTLKYSEVMDFKKILKYQDTLRINDSVLIAFDTLNITLNPKNNIFKVSVRDLLMHKSGITPTLPILPYVIFKKDFYDSLEINKKRFYEKNQNDTSIKNKNLEFNPRREIQKIYDTYFSKRYIRDSAEIKIAENFYFKNNWFDTLWRDTKRLRVYSRKIYQYSDINMILLQSAIDSLNHRSMNSFMRKTFYLPMGLQTMCYKPQRYFSLRRIVPTEDDKYWREQLLRGNVHDPSAAILGGISGNAGLFSDARDLAVLGQMWLNGGTYGGIRFISKSTINKFTRFQDDSFRGLGFDKPHKKAIIAKDAPPESFGHTGFTGTCIWVDPVNDIVFVFLSNRVNPSAKNWKINRLKIRQKIHQTVYDAMK